MSLRHDIAHGVQASNTLEPSALRRRHISMGSKLMPLYRSDPKHHCPVAKQNLIIITVAMLCLYCQVLQLEEHLSRIEASYAIRRSAANVDTLVASLSSLPSQVLIIYFFVTIVAY